MHRRNAPYFRTHTARSGGFTLIELLVVVAIIALLISILLPSLSRAREQARTVKCAANLKQFGLGMHMYADGSGGEFPEIHDGGKYGAWFRNPTFRSVMGQGNDAGALNASDWDEGLFCPTFPDRFLDPGYAYSFKDHGRVYGVNTSHAYEGPLFAADTDSAVNRTSVMAPSSTIHMGDANTSRITKYAANPTYWEATGELAGYEGGVSNKTTYRHNGSANNLFFDGHAETMSQDEVFPDHWRARDQLWYVYDR